MNEPLWRKFLCWGSVCLFLTLPLVILTPLILLGAAVVDADPDNTVSGGQTLVTDDNADDTPFIPAIKRLVATDSSIALDTTTSDLAIGIKAVDYADPVNGIEIREDFLWGSNYGVVTQFTGYNGSFQTGNIGRGSGANPATITNPGVNTIGGIEIGQGKAATPNINNNVSFWSVPPPWDTYQGGFPVGAGVAEIRGRWMLYNSPDSNNDEKHWPLGLFAEDLNDGPTWVGSPFGGFYFYYDWAASPAHLYACTATGNWGSGGANETKIDTGLSISSATWYRFKILTNANWTSATFYVNNSLVATINSSNAGGKLPTSSADKVMYPVLAQRHRVSGSGALPFMSW